MTEAKRNGLEHTRSAYLRSARHQPVDWNEWGPEAFDKARAQDKPVLLDIGAVWCHWCHVMDRESYENPETAALINQHFVAVKVDRDERPDVDARYQAAVAAISGQGGWPLTAFLTPEGKPFFGGTYFPPTDGHGRPGLRRVLATMAEAFAQKRNDVDDSAASVMAAIEHNESFNGSAKNPGAGLLAKVVAAALQQFDSRHGGFGSQPKFPHSGALDLLLDSAARGQGDEARAARLAAMVTLEKMARGGIYDHLAGGFHRYSVDERWVVPHFEKMSYDNSELLKNYVHAYLTTGEPACARVAREILRWVDEWLSDRELGGFYASQDADDSLDDDGDYFTWTRAEAAAVLSADEMRLAGPWFDIGELGDMHHNPEKNVLHLELTLAELARAAGTSTEHAATQLEAIKHKLYQARKQRPTPYVDKTVYVGWNGMMISAYLEAGRALEEPAVTAFALRTLDRVLDAAWDGRHVGHVVSYGEQGGDRAGNIAGVLDDYVLLANAALDAWEATGNHLYAETAQAIADALLAGFYDSERGGFFDTAADAPDRIGALSTRRKPLQDSPTPAGNATGASLLLRLATRTWDETYRHRAQATLECFAGVVEHFGLYAGSYGLALSRLTHGSLEVTVVGDDAAAEALARAALAPWLANKSVLRLRTADGTSSDLPALAQSYAVVCRDRVCSAPVTDVEALRAALQPAHPRDLHSEA